MKAVSEIMNLEPGGEIRVGDGAPGVNFSGFRISKNSSGYDIATYKDDEPVMMVDSEGFLSNAAGARMAFLSDVPNPQAVSTAIKYLSLSRAVTTLARDLKEDVACISIPIVPIGEALFETGDILVLVNHTDAETVQLTVSANQLAGDDHIHVNSWIPQQKFYRGSAIYQSDKQLLSMIIQTENAIALKVGTDDFNSTVTVLQGAIDLKVAKDDILTEFSVKAGSITATANVFKSNNWNGTVDSNGHITVAGTAGWAITGYGEAEFASLSARGTFTSEGSTGQWSKLTTGTVQVHDDEYGTVTLSVPGLKGGSLAVGGSTGTLTFGDTFTYAGNTVWHAGNDGASSGLDADTLDGSHASAFVLTSDSRLSDARPASDVYSWAKAPSKPSYSYSEVGACSSSDSRLSDSRPASDVYSWAKASTKPSYTKSEVGLGNVDNTADASKNVNYANLAAEATAVAWSGITGKPYSSFGTMSQEDTASWVSHSWFTGWIENVLQPGYAPIFSGASGTYSSPTIIVVSNGIVTSIS